MAEIAVHVTDTARGTAGDWWAACRCGWLSRQWEWLDQAEGAAQVHRAEAASRDSAPSAPNAPA